MEYIALIVELPGIGYVEEMVPSGVNKVTGDLFYERDGAQRHK
jgi:hypothetical protein